jgi:NADPH:quinone reductase-like Zn-dependent oxidoreductase
MSRAVGYSRYGGPEVLGIVEVPEPHAGSGTVRVAVRSAGVNPFDSKVRRGGYLPNHTLPSLQGAEFAGVIDEIGDGVGGWRVGDEVLGWIGRGAQAEYLVVSAKNLAAKPPSLDWDSAGGIGLVGNTAMRATASLAITADDTVLVSGAAGGVGLLSAQLARRTGATVIGTASERHHAMLSRWGIVPVDYGPGLVDRLRAVAPDGITAVLDSRGDETIEAALALGAAPERINSTADGAADRYGVNSVGGGGKTAAELAELARLVAEGELVLPIRSRYPLSEASTAYADLDSGHGLGKIVLTVP